MNEKRSEGTTRAERAPVTISRDLDYPRAAVFEMFRDPKKAERWFGTPDGAVKVLFEWDLRPGATFRIRDRMEGRTAETVWTVLELSPPERLVLRSATAPEGGAAPWVAQQSVRLEELGPRRTRLVVHVEVLDPGSIPGGVEALEEGYEGGWGQTLDVLMRELRSGSGVAGDPRSR